MSTDPATASADGVQSSSPSATLAATSEQTELRYICYGTEKESPYLPAIRQLISKDLSEPYSIYVYRYFLYQWPDLCFMAIDASNTLIGVIICKLEPHRHGPLRGYIAMLATRSSHRGKGIATRLVRLAVQRMIERNADEIALETEVDNVPSLRIYEGLGFLRTKRLHRYYLNGNPAFRLVLYLKGGIPSIGTWVGDGDGMEEDRSGGASMVGSGLITEDLLARQTAQMSIGNAQGG